MSARRPNILFIFSDQQHRFALGCMDNPDVITPNIDALAARGALFTQAYTCCPVCTAARINFLTGRYSNQTNSIGNCAPIPSDVTTLPMALKAAGYTTAFVGKWHIGGNGNRPVPRELQGGFDYYTGYQCYNGFLHEVCFWDENGEKRQFDHHRTDVTADLAIEKMDALSGSPFFLMVGFQAPHYPEEPSYEYAKMYEGKRIAPRANAREGVEPYTPTYSPPSPKPRENDHNYCRYGSDMDEYRRLYNAMVTQIDANVGRLLTRLEELGIADDTIVLYTSDHGDMQGSQGITNKCAPFEESAGIPLVARAPGGVSGITSDAIVSGVDYMPTFLDLAGAPAPQGVMGRSFASVLRGERHAHDGPVFSEMHKWRMVRTRRWKLVVEGDDDHATRLYDMADDPHEMTNLVDAPEHAETVTSLRGEILAWRERCRDRVAVG